MNVLFVNMSLDPVTGGGTAERTIQLCHALSQLGHACSILTLDVGLSEEFKNRIGDSELICLPCLNRRFYVPKFSSTQIREIISRTDVIHIMGHWTFINALVYFFARQFGKPYAVCPAGALPIFGRSKAIKIFYNAVVGHAIIRNANYHVAVADNEISHFAKYGISAARVTIIPNGVNPCDFEIEDRDIAMLRTSAGLGSDPYLLFMGRLNLIKGPDLLLQAFLRLADRFPDVHLVFAGPDGGMLPELKKQVSALKQDRRVHFVGHVAGRLKAAAYRSAMLLVVPSRQEAMSIVALESGVCGVPVLMTDQCGFGSLSGIGGGLIVPATGEALSEGLISLFEKRDTLPDMGGRFKSYILKHFTWQVAALAYLNLFNTKE